MKIMQVNFINRYNRLQNNDCNRNTITNSINKNNTNGYVQNIYYAPVNFKSRTDDIKLISEMRQTISDIINAEGTRLYTNYIDDSSYNFKSALTAFANKDESAFEKLSANPQTVKQIESNFNQFKDTVLQSIDEVVNPELQKKFHEEVSKNSTNMKITKEILGVETIEEVNKELKQADSAKIIQIKDALSVNWIYEQLDKKISSDKELDSEERLNISSKYNDEFEDCTSIKYDEATTNNKKMEAFQVASVVLDNALRTTGDNEVIFEVIKELESSLDKAEEKRDLSVAKDSIKKYFDLALDEYAKTILPAYTDRYIETQQYVREKETNYFRVMADPIYDNLDINNKFVVIKYLENFDKNDKRMQNKNPLLSMFEDTTVTEDYLLHRIIPKATANIALKESSIINNLNSMHEIINSNFETEAKSDNPCFSPNDKYSYSGEIYGNYIQKYIEVFFGKNYSLLRHGQKIKLLRELPVGEFDALTQKVKQDWREKELKHVIRSEFRNQASKNNIQTKSYKQLITINENLDNIKVSLDNISHSINEMVVNIKKMPEIYDSKQKQKEIKEKSQQTLTDIDKKYKTATIEEKEKMDKKVKEQLPIVIEELKANCSDTDKKTIEALTFLESKVRNSKSSTSEFVRQAQRMFAYEANYAIRSKISNLSMKPLKTAITSPKISLDDLSGSLMESAGESGGLGTALSSLMDPVTLVVLATAVFACYSIAEVNNIESGMRPLYYKL